MLVLLTSGKCAITRMKKNQYYSLQDISGTIHLLPFGQAVASHRPGAVLGGSAVQIWDMACLCRDTEELVSLALSRLDPDDPGRTGAEADIRQFIRDLKSLGILEEDDPLQTAAEREKPYSVLQAGPMRVELRGDAGFFHPDFSSFLVPVEEGAAYDQIVTVTESLPPDHAGLTCLLHNSELEVYQGSDRIIMCFPSMPGIEACMLSPDGAEAVYYVRACGKSGSLQSDLFHAIRHAVLYRAGSLKLFVLHSASVLYKDRAWLFSAQAGTGKSTHAALWHEAFDAPVLNGDLAMLSLSDRGAVFHPLPWCGTSGTALNGTHPLGGIAFLKRGHENTVRILPPEERPLRIANRLISPVWTESRLIDNLDFAKAMSSAAMIWELSCTPEPEAAFCMKEAVDRCIGEVSADV